jgi:hypothetical protein
MRSTWGSTPYSCTRMTTLKAESRLSIAWLIVLEEERPRSTTNRAPRSRTRSSPRRARRSPSVTLARAREQARGADGDRVRSASYARCRLTCPANGGRETRWTCYPVTVQRLALRAKNYIVGGPAFCTPNHWEALSCCQGHRSQHVLVEKTSHVLSRSCRSLVVPSTSSPPSRAVDL